MYLRELKNYKPPQVKASDAEGHVGLCRLLNRFGLLATEAAASNLVEAPIGLDLAAVRHLPLNPAGYMIHAAVYLARPEVQAVMHVHSPAAMAVSCLAEGRTESTRMPWQDTIDVLETMDEVRRQVGVVYPGE